MKTTTDPNLYEQARKRVDFKTHLLVYVLLNSFIWVMWSFTSRHYPWPLWPMFGWAIGLIFHYLNAYGPKKFLSIDEEYKKLKEKQDNYTEVTHEQV